MDWQKEHRCLVQEVSVISALPRGELIPQEDPQKLIQELKNLKE